MNDTTATRCALWLLGIGVAVTAAGCGSSKPKSSPTFAQASATPTLAASPTPAPECLATSSFTGDLSGALTIRVNAVHSGSELRIEGQATSGLGSALPIDLLVDIEPFIGAGTYPAVNTLVGGTASPSPATPTTASASATSPSPTRSPSPSAVPGTSPSPTSIAAIRSSVLSLVFDPARSDGFGWSTARGDGSGNATGSVTVSSDLQTVTVTSPIWQSNLASHSDTGKTASANVSVFCPQPLR